MAAQKEQYYMSQEMNKKAVADLFCIEDARAVCEAIGGLGLNPNDEATDEPLDYTPDNILDVTVNENPDGMPAFPQLGQEEMDGETQAFVVDELAKELQADGRPAIPIAAWLRRMCPKPSRTAWLPTFPMVVKVKLLLPILLLLPVWANFLRKLRVVSLNRPKPLLSMPIRTMASVPWVPMVTLVPVVSMPVPKVTSISTCPNRVPRSELKVGTIPSISTLVMKVVKLLLTMAPTLSVNSTSVTKVVKVVKLLLLKVVKVVPKRMTCSALLMA